MATVRRPPAMARISGTVRLSMRTFYLGVSDLHEGATPVSDPVDFSPQSHRGHREERDPISSLLCVLCDSVVNSPALFGVKMSRNC
jgi:hypothetical protein